MGNWLEGRVAYGNVVVMSKPSSLMDDFRPIMPPLVRLLAGVIVLIVIQATILSFPGITQLIPTTGVTIANVVIFSLGLIVAGIVLKYGTQLGDSIGEAYKEYKTWTPLVTWFFQIAALVILYNVSKGITASTFASIPWAYPLLFLLVALVPTFKVVMRLVNGLEGKNTSKHLLTN